MLQRFSKYVFQSVAGMVGVSVYVLADTFFISVYAGADGLAVLNLILPVYGLIYAIGSMIGIGSATRYGISKAKGERADYYFTQAIAWSVLISIPFVLLGIFGTARRGCRTCCTRQDLSAYHPHRNTVFYVELFRHGICPK